MVEEMDYLKIDYEMTRKRMDKKKDNQVKYFTVIVSILAIVYGLIFQSYLALDLILILPLLIIPFGLRFQWLNEGVRIQGKYLKDIEEKIVKKLKTQNSEIEWKGFHHFWYNEHRRWKTLAYDIGSKWLLFIGIPMFISFMYCVFRVTDVIVTPQSLGDWVYGSIGVIYCVIIIVSFLVFILGYYNKNKVEFKKELFSTNTDNVKKTDSKSNSNSS